MIKQCAVCGKAFEGYCNRIYCDPCRDDVRRRRKRKAGREFYEANPEKMRERARKWRKANPEKVSGPVMLWRKANPEKLLAYSIKWRKANPQKVKAYQKRWRQANPEKQKEYDERCNNKLHKDYGDALFFQMMESMTAISEAVETTTNNKSNEPNN